MSDFLFQLKEIGGVILTITGLIALGATASGWLNSRSSSPERLGPGEVGKKNTARSSFLKWFLLVVCLAGGFLLLVPEKIRDQGYEFAMLTLYEISSDEISNAPSAADKQVRASFDCTKAATRTENAICSDSELATADWLLADAYSKQQSGSSSNKVLLRDAQRNWILSRDRRCSSIISEVEFKDCLLNEINARTSQLNGNEIVN